MPEMADVEVYKRKLNRIAEAHRYGKYLFLKSGKGYLVLHFGLTGHLKFVQKDKKPESGTVVLETEDTKVVYEPGLYGKMDRCENIDAFVEKKKLGPDAGSVPEKEFMRIIGKSAGAIKTALMDQHKISGIGNVYADEILFQSKIHPLTPAKKIPEGSLEKIYHEIHRVHQAAVKVGAERPKMPAWALMKTRHSTRICPSCDKVLKNIKVNGRETFFCEHCQKKTSQPGPDLFSSK